MAFQLSWPSTVSIQLCQPDWLSCKTPSTVRTFPLFVLSTSTVYLLPGSDKALSFPLSYGFIQFLKVWGAAEATCLRWFAAGCRTLDDVRARND